MSIEKMFLSILAMVILLFMIVVVAGTVNGRAQAMKECYKAAQVNTNIKCED